MPVEICVSSEELKKTLEYMSLVCSAGLKKKDDDDTAGAMRITAVCPKNDYRYMLMFCRMGATSQLLYRMEGKSDKSSDDVDVYVDGKRFIALAKAATGDVRLVFDDKEITIKVGRSKYHLATVDSVIPPLVVPDGGMEIPTKLLADALKHCAPTITKNAVGVRAGINIKINKDGSAVCWSFSNACAAKLMVPSVGVQQEVNVTLLPSDIQHVITLAESEDVRMVITSGGIYFTAVRFDYMCRRLEGMFPDCDAMSLSYKKLKSYSVDKMELVHALNRCSVIAGGDGAAVKIFCTEEDLLLQTESAGGNGMECIAANSVTGEDGAANNLSVSWLQRIVYACQGEAVTIASCGAFKAYFVSATGSDSFYMLMSMRGK